MQQCFHPSAEHLLYKYITPSFVGHSFGVKGVTWYFLLGHRCAFWFNLKYIFSCRYASTVELFG